MSEFIPLGLCQCGCGERTNICTFTDKRRGYVKGEPYRFLSGHHAKLPEVRKKYAQLARERTGPDALNWKGGRYIDNGYVHVWAPDHPNAMADGYVMESRLVASKILGRPLLDDEKVWHKDGDRLNVAPDNLEVITAAELLRRVGAS